MTESIARRFVNVSEASSYTGISISQLNKYRVFGGGPTYHKIGRRVIYTYDDLDFWLAAYRRVTTSDVGDAA